MLLRIAKPVPKRLLLERSTTTRSTCFTGTLSTRTVLTNLNFRFYWNIEVVQETEILFLCRIACNLDSLSEISSACRTSRPVRKTTTDGVIESVNARTTTTQTTGRVCCHRQIFFSLAIPNSLPFSCSHGSNFSTLTSGLFTCKLAIFFSFVHPCLH